MTPRILDVVGVVPAAGRAKRIAPLPCSKELYPIGFRRDEQSGDLRPKVASHFLFEKFSRAGVTKAYVILREGKWDIPAYFGDGQMLGMDVAYLVLNESLGPPDTLDRAYPFVENKCVAFGFPDILFGPDDVFSRLLDRLRETDTDIVLGLYPAHDVRQVDMIDIAADGRIDSITLKPDSSTLHYTWICAVWTAVFSRFMHKFLEGERSKSDLDRLAYRDIDPQGDLPVGAVLKAALEAGLHVEGLRFPHERYLDIGTPDNLLNAARTSTSLP
jgi:dTDP-glucose pyrophosphorylase